MIASGSEHKTAAASETRKSSTEADEQDEELLTVHDLVSDPTNSSHIHCILPGLYLTGVSGASELWKLKLLNVAAIVNCGDASNTFPDRFEYLRVELRDLETADLTIHLDSVLNFIHSRLSLNGNNRGDNGTVANANIDADDGDDSSQPKQKPRVVLVHCAMGMSRSASLVIAYLMKHREMSFQNALQCVRSARNCVEPNAGFVRQLLAFEATLRKGNRTNEIPV
jgi:predicted protein tyrosine phosphatase